jgi:Tfp pilus assembly protein PilN
MQSINLIPQQEVQQQSQEKAVAMSTWLSILVLVIVGGFAGFDFYREVNLKSQTKALESEIGTLRQQISSMANVEVNARNLDKKFSTLKDVFGTRMQYSMLSTELAKRTPSGIIIDSITLQKGSKLNITGHADNYILIASFTNNLVNADFQGGTASLKKLFTTVTLNSVNLEKNRNIVRFSINTDLNGDLLRMERTAK